MRRRLFNSVALEQSIQYPAAYINSTDESINSYHSTNYGMLTDEQLQIFANNAPVYKDFCDANAARE